MKYSSNNIVRHVRCKSGLFGERSRLQSRYSDFEEFLGYDQIYNLSERLGFCSATKAWNSNPVVESSIHPEDLRVVKEEEEEE